jgi:hypothetical protein
MAFTNLTIRYSENELSYNDSNRDLTNMVMPGSFSYSYLLALGLIRISKQAPFGENLQDLLKLWYSIFWCL